MPSPGPVPRNLQARPPVPSASGRRFGTWSVVALVGFAPWTAAFIVATAALARSWGLDPDQPFGTEITGLEWLQWATAAVVWVLPLLTAAVLGWVGMRRGGGTRARVGAFLGAGLAAMLLLETGLQALFA